MNRFARWMSVSGALAAIAAACTPAHAERAPERPEPIAAAAPEPVRSPYQVEVLSPGGRALDTYEHRGRHYLRGREGQRYVIRVGNPTSRRVEAVISVDGLDVIDGETADFVRKRGYVVPARGELRVEGFRMSTRQVAAFRFSSVADSYAGRKGKDRNVGVIGVAIFEEKAPTEVIAADPPPPPPRPHPRPHRRDRPDREERSAPADADGAERAPAPAGGRATGSRGAPGADHSAGAPARRRQCCQNNERPGLGTEFGERRHSAVSWTRFRRADPRHPTAVATLRYNDAAGLRALGIELEPGPNADELAERETADPFPASDFAEPPPR